MKNMKKGFTLIELLIVIAIIGILAGVILVSTSSARQKAQLSTVKQTLGSLKSAVTLCCSEGTAVLNTTGDVCTPAVQSLLPTTIVTGSVTASFVVTGDCTDANPRYTVTVNGGTLPAGCTGTNTWVVGTTGLIVPNTCS